MGISIIGGASAAAPAGNGFRLSVGASGDTTYVLDSPQPAGMYFVSSLLEDNTYDIYFASSGANVGYTSGASIAASAEFDTVVVYGATTDDIITFDYKVYSAPSSSGAVTDGVAPFATSATPVFLENIDDTTTVTGGNFAADVEVVFVGADAVERAAKSVVRSSTTELVVTRPDVLPTAQQPYDLVVRNAGISDPTTNVHKLIDYITCGITVSGGTVTSDATYNYHTFLASDSLVISGGSVSMDYLVIAGGGGGGRATNQDYAGGGGGAGGLLNGNTSVSAATHTITIGGGGAVDASGTDSIFGSLVTSTGGGYGGNGPSGNGGNGGSGGGAVYSSGTPGTGIAGQGFAGGNGGLGSSHGGGDGLQFSDWSTAIGLDFDGGYFAGGGEGGQANIGGVVTGGGGGGAGEAGNDPEGSVGGLGGGGNVRQPGDANSGGGGGGAYNLNGTQYSGGAGGSGLIVIRYDKTLASAA